MAEVGFLVVGLAVGAAVAWVLATARSAGYSARTDELRSLLEASRAEAARLQGDLRTAAADRAAAEARAAAAQAGLEEEKGLLLEAQAKLGDAFKALAAEALKSSNQDFLALAETRFAALRQEAQGDLEARKTAIETLVQPLRQALGEYQHEAKALEEKRLREISGVGQQLQDVARAQTSLQRETANLVNALRAPQVRGRWGEIALRKTAELAGMTEHCDFVQQESVAGEGGRLRPDMVVRLPARREIVVDSKVALNGYLEALEATTPEEREAALKRHAQQVRTHVKQLASKEYWSQFPQAPEFVVLFIPGEAFFAAAAERDPDLLQDALTNHVLVATPTTFIGLLLTAAYGWRQEQIAENAERISELGQELYDRLTTLVGHIGDVGKALGRSVEAYNRVVGSWLSRVQPSARRFSDLGVGGTKELESPEPIDEVPRALAAGEGPAGTS